MKAVGDGPGLRLVVISGSGGERQIPVPAHGIVLGRDDQLGPPFSTDEFVSRTHVSVQRRGDDQVEIADLGSANGTYLNGTQVHGQARMQAGDVLRIGRIELTLDPAAARAVPPGAAMSAGPQYQPTLTSAPCVTRDSPCLAIITPGSYSGRRFQLTGPNTVIGREPTCDIHLDDPYISRVHAAIRRHEDAAYVQDLGSAAGTFVNGAAVTAVCELHPGDIVALARVKARFESA